MKTAIVKTSFWDEEEFTALHIDTKLVYMHLLTCPSKGLSPYLKINKAVMSARTGLNKDTVQLGLDQLKSLGWIDFHKGYVYILKNHVEAKKGRFTEGAIEKELEDIPQEVVTYFYRYNTGTLPVHKYKDSNIDSNNDNTIDKIQSKEVSTVEPTATNLSIALLDSLKENYPFLNIKEKDPEKWAKDIEKIHRIDGHEWELIALVLRWSQQNDFWKQNIRSGSKFRKQFEQLLVRMKAEHDNQRKHGVDII